MSIKECEHKRKDYLQVMYSNRDYPCEFTNKCLDCGKVLGYQTGTYKVTPTLVGVDNEI